MRQFLSVFCALLLVAASGYAGETGTRAMTGWFNVSTPDGWSGRRYMDGKEIFAEEFDSDGDNRIDVWRFYRRGVLTSEERDLNGDGKVNYQSRWDPREKRLVLIQRDSKWRGVNDLEIEALTNRRWEIREDRNLDSITDRILIVNGPPDLFERLGMDLARQQDVIDNIPMEYWYELWLDDAFSGTITDHRRYHKGKLTHYGDWDGRKINWRRCEPDFTPPVRTPPIAPIMPAQEEHDPFCTIPNCDGGFCRVEPSDAPIYDVKTDPESGATFMSEPYAEPEFGSQPYEMEPQIYSDPLSTQGKPPALQDRTRYEGLPPGDTAARSLPARMRPPGGGKR